MIGRLRRASTLAALVLLVAAAAPPAGADETELRLGNQILQQYEKQGIILHDTRYNAIVEPIAERMIPTGRGLYDEPFRFYVIHQKDPNAFAVPGGLMFINDALIDFVKYEDELACVSGHEMGHVIHHDVMHRLKREQQTGALLAVGQLLLGGRVASVANLGVGLQELHFDRGIESAADRTGSELCAKAGYNPYGLVWMMEQFESLPNQTKTMEMFSDHPRDDHRIADLETFFRSEPSVFAHFTDDKSTGRPLRK
jgi:predicted Zn-dependent protease